MIDLHDMECLHAEGILHKYARRSDGALFSVKSLSIPENSRPEHHPLIQNLQKLAPHPHPNLPKYYGYATRPEGNSTQLLVFLEDSEGALSDYLQHTKLSREELSRLVNEMIEVLIFMDRTAYALPSTLSPYAILVSKDTSGRTHFKPFAALTYDDSRGISEGDLKFSAPEVFERANLRRTHLNINAEKAVFYSLGVLTLYCATQDVITSARTGIESSHFTTRNNEIESEAANLVRTKVFSQTNDPILDAILKRLLIYNEKERPDFRVWQRSQVDGVGENRVVNKGGPGSKKKPAQANYVPPSNNQKAALDYERNIERGNGGKSKKNACKNACCNIF